MKMYLEYETWLKTDKWINILLMIVWLKIAKWMMIKYCLNYPYYCAYVPVKEELINYLYTYKIINTRNN